MMADVSELLMQNVKRGSDRPHRGFSIWGSKMLAVKGERLLYVPGHGQEEFVILIMEPRGFLFHKKDGTS
jgi:hypothetical protein